MKLFNVMSTAFENFDSTVQSYLAKTFGTIGYQYTNNQIFAVIFNGIKGIMQNVMFYIEDAFTEQNIETAVRKKSIYSLAKQSGFVPNYGYTATGTILCKGIANRKLNITSSKIYIKNHTYIRNTVTGIQYLILLPTDNYIVDINKPTINHEFKVIQGTYNVSNYVAKGKQLETVSITTMGLWDKDYLSVYVNNIKYVQVANMYDMTENGNEYILTVGYDNAFDIIFGNGIYGKKLDEGDNIKIEYVTHSGSLGNILSTDTYDLRFESHGEDAIGNSIDLNNYLILSMNNYISGGVDADTIDLVKSMIGHNSRSLVLASEDNYKLFFKRFSFIGYINVWSEENSMNICISCLSNKYNEIKTPDEYYNITKEEILLTPYQKEIITSALRNSKKAFAGITLQFIDPVIRYFAVMCYVKVTSTYSIETVKINISNLIAKYFMNLESNTRFIAKSDIITYVLANIENVEAFDIVFISKLAEDTYKNGYYDKYCLQYINGVYQYYTKRIMYEASSQPGLDAFGNISLDSNIEIPMIHGGSDFKYYDKENVLYSSNISVNPIEFIFI